MNSLKLWIEGPSSLELRSSKVGSGMNSRQIVGVGSSVVKKMEESIDSTMN